MELSNLGTFYVCIPLSSTHTLVGVIIGASLGFIWFYGGLGLKINQYRSGKGDSAELPAN